MVLTRGTRWEDGKSQSLILSEKEVRKQGSEGEPLCCYHTDRMLAHVLLRN